MSRFKFLQNDFFKLYQLCNQAENSTDSAVILLKSRQALEFMIHTLGCDSKQDLFLNINQLEEQHILDNHLSSIFHFIRRLANQAIHNNQKVAPIKLTTCLNQLFELTIWFATNQGKTFTLANFTSNDLIIARKYVTSANSNHKIDSSLCIDPLAINDDFTTNNNLKYDILTKDIFETSTEYTERIANIEPIQIGYGILDPRRKDNYTQLTFLIHHIDSNKKIKFAPISAFFCDNIHITDIVDDEIVAKLKVYKEKIYCDYSKIYLRNNEQLIPLKVICWDKFAYETADEYQKRIESLPLMPLGIAIPIRNQYNLTTSTLPFMIKPYPYVKKILTPLLESSQNLTISCTRDFAKTICNSTQKIFMIGKFSSNLRLTQYILWQQQLHEICNFHNASAKDTKDNHLAEEFFQKAQTSDSDTDKVYWLQKSAKLGNKQAQNDLGYHYENGIGVEKNPTLAVKFYTLSAQQNYALAQYNLALCYQEGIGTLQNPAQAIKFYTLSAQQNYALAQYNLALCYQYGINVKPNLTKAIELYTLSANQDYPLAQNNLGVCYQNGIGVKQDFTRAVEFYTLATKQNYATAQSNLAFCYQHGIGTKQDLTKAIHLYTLSANQGNCIAQYNLGYCYDTGTGVEKNLENAIKFYTLSANQNYPLAQNNLGICYQHGIGVEQNLNTALELYTLSANQNNPDAQYNLALCYRDGIGVYPNKETFLYWLKKSANQGNNLAQTLLKNSLN